MNSRTLIQGRKPLKKIADINFIPGQVPPDRVSVNRKAHARVPV